MINKNAENRDKWFARFMCVFIACCLWIYVMSEQNPIVEKEFAIPLASRNLAEGMIVFNVPEKVSVRVRGTRTALANMPESDIFAFVNLSKLSVGTHTILVNARFARGDILRWIRTCSLRRRSKWKGLPPVWKRWIRFSYRWMWEAAAKNSL